MRTALVVGIDHYPQLGRLYGCVNDARWVEGVLGEHADGKKNFDVELMTGSNAKDAITRGALKDAVQQLFSAKADIALLYFAGHGHLESSGGYLCTSECEQGDEGVSLATILKYANDSKSRNKVILLDSCHSGVAGDNPLAPDIAMLSEGMTILTASTAGQYAEEKDGRGVFTHLLVDALNGSAANLTGDVTPGSVYAHIDQSLGWFGGKQRPVFKTNVQSFVSLRCVKPAIALEDLKRITELFPSAEFQFQLDPSYEPERGNPGDKLGIDVAPPPDPENNRKFALLQKYNRVNLLIPVDAPHMWHAAMQSKSCKLTPLGEHYRRLVETRRI